MNELGEYLKELRGKRSLREMERITGLSHTYLSSLEKGADPRSGKLRQPSLEALKKISEAFEVPMVKLLLISGYQDFAFKYTSQETLKLYVQIKELQKLLGESDEKEKNDLKLRIDSLTAELNDLQEQEELILQHIQNNDQKLRKIADEKFPNGLAVTDLLEAIKKRYVGNEVVDSMEVANVIFRTTELIDKSLKK